MKLKNKKTGKIGYLYEHSLVQDIIIVYDVKGIVGKYISLAELNEEWEDYEEPKEYWYIDPEGTIICEPDDEAPYDNYRKQIGNYFDTREEAEKAVEKLKAVKRLKDKGFEFTGWGCENQKLYAKIRFNKKAWATETEPDLDLLFGGEE